ncbi:hypothetical protein E2C01_051944 [Portunus trituberculatus]|uniref:Uncharacterized protein n=1 Tax=Portunus trituberculatus TaxID=210409 RepID=A0A5B7GG87_PORTR|nr:hypothetical protein [Portunus trituberculatus]
MIPDRISPLVMRSEHRNGPLTRKQKSFQGK